MRSLYKTDSYIPSLSSLQAVRSLHCLVTSLCVLATWADQLEAAPVLPHTTQTTHTGAGTDTLSGKEIFTFTAIVSYNWYQIARLIDTYVVLKHTFFNDSPSNTFQVGRCLRNLYVYVYICVVSAWQSSIDETEISWNQKLTLYNCTYLLYGAQYSGMRRFTLMMTQF